MRARRGKVMTGETGMLGLIGQAHHAIGPARQSLCPWGVLGRHKRHAGGTGCAGARYCYRRIAVDWWSQPEAEELMFPFDVDTVAP